MLGRPERRAARPSLKFQSAQRDCHVLTDPSLLLGVFLRRSAHVGAFLASLRTCERAVDVHGATEILPARREITGRNQSIDEYLDRGRIVSREVDPLAGPLDPGRIGGSAHR